MSFSWRICEVGLPWIKGFQHLTDLKKFIYICAAAKSLQSCPTLCDHIDSSPPGSPVPGILQARTLEWVAISFSSAWKWKVKVKSLSRVQLLATPWTTAYQAPPSMGFSRQEYWSRVPLPSPYMYIYIYINTVTYIAYVIYILYIIWIYNIIGLSRWLSGKETTCKCRRCKRYGFHPWVWKMS